MIYVCYLSSITHLTSVFFKSVSIERKRELSHIKYSSLCIHMTVKVDFNSNAKKATWTQIIKQLVTDVIDLLVLIFLQ